MGSWGPAAVLLGLWLAAATEPDAVQSRTEELWQPLFTEAEGVGTDCSHLGSHLIDAWDSNGIPPGCSSKALLVGADTIEMEVNASRCHLRRCGTFAGLRLTSRARATQSHSFLIGSWHQVARAREGLSSRCSPDLGSYALVPGDDFPSKCQHLAIARGADTFDAEPDASRCYFKRCDSLRSIEFASDEHGDGLNTFSLLGKEWRQITRAAEGVSVDCQHLAEVAVRDPLQFQVECSSRAAAVGGDTFDVGVGAETCRIQRCGEFADIRFINNPGASDSYTMLGGAWSQIARAAEGFSTDCLHLGTHELTDSTDFPLACYSRAAILGGDTFDVPQDRSVCHLKKCGTLGDVKLVTAQEGQDVHTTLTGGWTRLAEGLVANCPSVGSFEAPSAAQVPEACYSRAVAAGGDTLETRVGSLTCSFKRCGTFKDLRLSAEAGTNETYTLLFPRSSAWDPCELGACVDLSIFYTAQLKGQFLPVDGSGMACDPEDSTACFGGNARRTGYIQQRRAESTVRNEALVFADLGGSTFGGPFDGHPEHPLGKPASMLQSLVPYDVTLLGPDDLLLRNSTLENRMDLAQSHAEQTSPLLLANVRFGGLLGALNSRLEPYKVFSTPSGVEVGFVGMLCHSPEYSHSFSPDSLDLDPEGLLAKIVNGSAHGLQLNLSGEADLRRVASLVSLDTLAAAEALKRAHPGVKAMVLLSTRCRSDVRQWMLETGPFDVVLEAEPEAEWSTPLLLWSRVHQKARVFAGSITSQGLGHLAVRVGPSGVRSFAFDADLPLAADVMPNATAQERSVELYEFIRRWEEASYGSISSPLTGAQRGGATPATRQCYYTDCPAGEHLGEAALWKARASGHLVDASLLPLAALGGPLEGHVDGTIQGSHCMAAVASQPTVALFSVLGNDLYEAMQDLLARGEIGFAGAGIRAAIHEPCWEFVDRATYATSSDAGSEQCTNNSVQVIDMEIEACTEVADCSQRQWRRLVKGATYVVATVDDSGLLQGHGFRPTGVAAGTLAQAICDYVAHHSPLQVETWEAYRDRGAVQFATVEQGFASGSRVPSVKAMASPIEEAALCLNGFHLPPGALECLPCEPGSRSLANSTRDRCELCPPGSFSNASGLSLCYACRAGRFSNQAGLSECKECSPGRFSTEGALECQGCQLGHYSDTPAAELCDPCPAGRFASSAGAESCEACSGQCPSNSSSRAVGAKSSDECCCPVGTFGITKPRNGTSGLAQSDGHCSPYISVGLLAGVNLVWNILPALAVFEQDLQRNLEGGEPIVRVPELSPLLRMQLQVVNTAEKVPLAQQGLSDLVRGQRGYTPVAGVIGALLSSVSLPVATIGGLLETVQISYSSTSAQLSDTKLYPFFMRTIASDDLQSQAILRCVLHFEVWSVTMLYYGDAYGTGIFQKLRTLALDRGLVDLVHGEELRKETEEDEGMVDAVVRSTKAAGIPFVVITVPSYVILEAVLPLMKRGGLWSPTFQFIFTESAFNSGLSEIQPAGSHCVFLKYESPARELFWDSFSQMRREDFIGAAAVEKWKMDKWDPDGGEVKDVEAKVNVSALNSVDGHRFMPFLFDTLYVYAHAFNSLLQQGLDPADLRGRLLLEAATKVNFTGATGPVHFDENGDRLMDFRLLNLQHDDSGKHSWVQVGVYFTASDQLRLSEATNLYWMDNSWSTTAPEVSIGCLADFHKGDERGQCVRGILGGFPPVDDDDGLVSWVFPFVLSIVGLLVGCCLTAAMVFYRKRQLSTHDTPTEITSPNGSWTAKWVGQHIYRKISMGSSRSLTQPAGRGRVSRATGPRPWVVNATPFAALLQSRGKSSGTANLLLQPYSAGLAPCSTEELEVEVFRMIGTELEAWQSLSATVCFTLEGSSWPSQECYDCPVRRIELPAHEAGRRAGHLRVAKSPNCVVLLSWSPPAEVRGMPLDEFERFLVEVAEFRTDVASADAGNGSGPESMDMYAACTHVIKQDVARVDASYAELRTRYGPPDLFISHVWSETAKNTLKAIRNFVKSQSEFSHRPTMLGMVPVECRVWFCTACNNQSRVTEELGPDVQQSPFARVIASPHCSKVALISPFLALTRKWCTFEFSLARHANKTTILVTTSGVVEAGQVAPRTLEDLAKQVSNFSSASANCSSLEDSQMIDTAVSQMGGYEEIDAQVRGACRSAIEEAHRWTSKALDSLKAESPLAAKVAENI